MHLWLHYMPSWPSLHQGSEMLHTLQGWFRQRFPHQQKWQVFRCTRAAIVLVAAAMAMYVGQRTVSTPSRQKLSQEQSHIVHQLYQLFSVVHSEMCYHLCRFVPGFGAFISLIGSLACALLAFVIPAFCHLRIFCDTMPR